MAILSGIGVSLSYATGGCLPYGIRRIFHRGKGLVTFGAGALGALAGRGMLGAMTGKGGGGEQTEDGTGGPTEEEATQLEGIIEDDLKQANATDPSKSQSNKHFYKSGNLTGSTSIKAKLGQVVWIKTKNLNVLGTTIQIESNYGQTQGLVLMPQQEHVFMFSQFSSSPAPWNFTIHSFSDVFIINYEIRSTWVPGMTPNP